LENGLEGVVDLVEMKAIYFDGDNGLIVRKEEIPENLMKTVRERKLELVAALADVEPKFEDYFMEENINIPAKELKEVIRRHTIARTFCPVFMGSAFKNKGVQPLLDGVIDYLPNPKEVENIALDLSNNEEKVVMEIDNKKPFVGLAFKLEETQYGQLTWIRIY
jgi:elongation factor G